jgi:hypothetical protein
MLQINDTIISLDLLEEHFVCDLASCKGACCVEGDEGAPVLADEVAIIEKLLPLVWDELAPESQQVIEKQGISYLDREGERAISIVNGAECVFTYYDEMETCKCVLEKAFREGRTDFYKPISCHLYPVRTKKFDDFTAVNYHRWHVCVCARKLGSKLKVPVYQFLKEPLIRKYGENWYKQLQLLVE